MLELSSWIGAITIIIAPLFKDIKTIAHFMTFGLALLTIQAFSQLNYNLIFLNIISMCVWLYKIIKTVKDEKTRIN